MSFGTYRKKPVEVQAYRNDGKMDHITAWCLKVGTDPGLLEHRFDGKVDIATLEGTMTAEVGDWIICGVKGELYPCKPDIFEATYDEVDDREVGQGATTRTGHEIGAIYEDTYWGGAVVVLGETADGQVEVERVVKASAGKHFAVGDRWTHRTALDHTKRKIGYAAPSQTEED